jgi:hypothetical protein
LYAHPAGDSAAETAHEWIITQWATIKYVRNLLSRQPVAE